MYIFVLCFLRGGKGRVEGGGFLIVLENVINLTVIGCINNTAMRLPLIYYEYYRLLCARNVNNIIKYIRSCNCQF